MKFWSPCSSKISSYSKRSLRDVTKNLICWNINIILIYYFTIFKISSKLYSKFSGQRSNLEFLRERTSVVTLTSYYNLSIFNDIFSIISYIDIFSISNVIVISCKCNCRIGTGFCYSSNSWFPFFTFKCEFTFFKGSFPSLSNRQRLDLQFCIASGKNMISVSLLKIDVILIEANILTSVNPDQLCIQQNRVNVCNLFFSV